MTLTHDDRNTSMKWPTPAQLSSFSPLPGGYRYTLLTRDSIPKLIDALKSWHASFSVGAASAYLREDFYLLNVHLDDAAPRSILVILILRGEELAGMFSAERDTDTLSLYARLAVVSPSHRGAGLMLPASSLLEPMAIAMNLEFIYAMATLKIPHVQVTLERLGYRLLGFVPGYDREELAPGVVKRVYEAVYGKVLVSSEALLPPNPMNLTPTARLLFEQVFPDSLSK